MGSALKYKEENDKLIESFLGRTFFKVWKDGGNPNFQSLEIMVNAYCNMSCQYCYLNRYQQQLFPDDSCDRDKIMRNLAIFFDWLIENDYKPKIELFSGELFSQEIGFQILEMILYKLAPHYSSSVVVPTNFSFVLDRNRYDRVIDILERSRKVGFPIYLSASFDGKYCEDQRPFKFQEIGKYEDYGRIWKWKYNDKKNLKDDYFYNEAFKLAKKYGFGFHPMIYSKNIEKWKDNFLWFQDMLKKYDIPFHSVYLLEVRNVEWSAKQIYEFGEFIKFLIDWSWKFVGYDIGRYRDFLFKLKGFNILSSPLTRVGRGIGCSVQSSIYLRPGDLTIGPCHRQCYKHLNSARFKVEEGKIVGLEALNPEYLIVQTSFQAVNQPYCYTCPIKYVCSFGCLGSQYEATGDNFTPIPTVCALEHMKIRAMIEKYEEIGILGQVLENTSKEKRDSFMLLREVLRR